MLTIYGNTKLAITQELAVGRRCYYNISTEKVIVEDDIESEAVQEAIHEHPADYILFSPPPESTALELVKGFAPQVKDKKEREHLLFALRRERPMAYFKAFINKYADERNAWFLYKKRYYVELVDKRIAEINEGK